MRGESRVSRHTAEQSIKNQVITVTAGFYSEGPKPSSWCGTRAALPAPASAVVELAKREPAALAWPGGGRGGGAVAAVGGGTVAAVGGGAVAAVVVDIVPFVAPFAAAAGERFLKDFRSRWSRPPRGDEPGCSVALLGDATAGSVESAPSASGAG